MSCISHCGISRRRRIIASVLELRLLVLVFAVFSEGVQLVFVITTSVFSSRCVSRFRTLRYNLSDLVASTSSLINKIR